MKTVAMNTKDAPAKTVGLQRKDLRIAVLSDATAYRNGVGSYYRDLAGHLRDQVERVSLVSPNRRSSGVYMVSFPLPGDSTQALRIPNAARISAYIKQLAPHVLIAASPGPFGLFGLYCSQRYQIPLCTGLHTDYNCLANMYWKGSAWGKVAEHYFRKVNRLMITRSQAVVGVNDELTNHAIDHGAKYATKVGSLVSRSYLLDPPKPRPVVENALFAGRLAREKNIPAIIEAAKQLPHIQFAIAGDGPLKDAVVRAEQTLPNLQYMGWLARNALKAAIDASDLLVLPSESETFGTVAIEAAARQKRVLVSSNCGLHDWPIFDNAFFKMAPHETLTQAILRVEQLPSEQQIATCHRAHQATIAFNQQSCDQWVNLLLDIAQPSNKLIL